MDAKELRRINHVRERATKPKFKDPRRNLLGYGFEWGAEHANRAYQVVNLETDLSGIRMPFPFNLLNKHLEPNEVFVLNKSYGLDGPKWSAKEIAKSLDIKGSSDYVRISELKKQAVEKLIENVDHSQVIDYL